MFNGNLALGGRLAAWFLLSLSLGATAVPRPVLAGSKATTLGVSLTINAACTVSAAPIIFSAQSVLGGAVGQTGAVVVTCTNISPYNIQFDQGAGASATVTNRQMTGPASATVSYALYRDAAHTLNWGKTNGTDTLAGTGNGTAQTLTVYGLVTAQSTPAPGAYADTVNVTVSF